MTDVVVAVAHGASNVVAAAGMLDQVQAVRGPAASTATVWRVWHDLDETALAALAVARAVQRRRVWAALAACPAGSPGWRLPGR